MGQSFTELCKIMPIVNEVLHRYYDVGDKVPQTTRISFDFAKSIYYRLLRWSDSLPVSMARGVQTPHHVATVQ